MNQQFQVQFPWGLALLALLPLYALLLGRPGRISALRFSSGELIRTVARAARSAAGSRQRLRITLIPEPGTAIGDATAAAARRLLSLKDSKSRIVILLTDGDNNRGELDPIPAEQIAAALGVKIYTIGIGKPEPCML